MLLTWRTADRHGICQDPRIQAPTFFLTNPLSAKCLTIDAKTREKKNNFKKFGQN